MSLNEEEKKILISIRLAKSEDAMRDVDLLLNNGRWVLLASRLYYSAYYIVSALLIAYGYTAKTHDGINQIFNRFFGQTKIIDTSLTRHYSRLLNLRIMGDYSDNYEIQEEDVLPLVEPTKELIETVSVLTKKKIGLE